MNYSDDLQKDETGIEIPTLTSKPKKFLIGIIMGIFLSYLLIHIFLDKSKKQMPPVKEDVNPINLYPIPKVSNPLKGKEIILSPTEPVNPNNTMKEEEDKKLILLRQHAPIQLYLAKSQQVIQENQSQTEQSSLEVYPTEMRGDDSNVNEYTQINRLITNNPISEIHEKTKQVGYLKNQDYLLLEGTMIPGILQTQIQSDLPGHLKAIVAEDVYAAKGKKVLIPKGSNLLGHYCSTTMQQQDRILVVWTRIIRPDGISIKLQAEGTDEVGQAGLTGKINHHTLARFGQASLLSLLGVGVGGSQILPSDTMALALANSFATAGKESLQTAMQIQPTIHIKAGTTIAVYVSQDISFYNVLKK